MKRFWPKQRFNCVLVIPIPLLLWPNCRSLTGWWLAFCIVGLLSEVGQKSIVMWPIAISECTTISCCSYDDWNIMIDIHSAVSCIIKQGGELSTLDVFCGDPSNNPVLICVACNWCLQCTQLTILVAGLFDAFDMEISTCTTSHGFKQFLQMCDLKK